MASLAYFSPSLESEEISESLKSSYNFSSFLDVESKFSKLSFSLVWEYPLIEKAIKMQIVISLFFSNMAIRIVTSKLTKVYDITQNRSKFIVVTMFF